jgi:hypothetical protein
METPTSNNRRFTVSVPKCLVCDKRAYQQESVPGLTEGLNIFFKKK